MKYELTKKIRFFAHVVTLRQIRALKTFASVSKGDLSGWIQSEKNLSKFDNALVLGNAQVYVGCR
jgi:hypothetical protein